MKSCKSTQKISFIRIPDHTDIAESNIVDHTDKNLAPNFYSEIILITSSDRKNCFHNHLNLLWQCNAVPHPFYKLHLILNQMSFHGTHPILIS